MFNRKFFFENSRRTLFDGSFRQSQIKGLTAMLDEWEKNWAKSDDRWLAYMLATAHHETDRTMQPIEEYGKGKKLAYGKRVKMSRAPYTDTDAIFYGRGFVQLTWYENYAKAGAKLKVDLLHHPELSMESSNASKIMFYGMTEGWFTGKSLKNYFNATTEDWINARRIINGTDKAQLISSYAKKYYGCLSHTV